MKLALTIFLVIISCFAFAQDTVEIKKKLEINGYIKNLQSFSFDKNFNNVISGNLLHNRMNLKWKPTGKFTASAELRNRLCWGEEVKITPEFAKQLKNENDFLNLQIAWVKKTNLVIHSNVERLWLDYRKQKWDIRMGRQRINWGITTTWNPNDIFNTYNFLDFDYEERPGSDAAKFQYLINDFSNIEIAASVSGKKNNAVSAVKYSFNKKGYDIQLITGWYQDQYTLGAGWAGNIKDAGFKSEVQYYFKQKDSSCHFNFCVETDYVFNNGWYINVGMLFSSNGFTKPVTNWDEINFKFSPQHLMPTKWNIISTVAKEFTPLISGNLSVVFAPGTDLLILLPALKYNIATNLDADFIWQSFFAGLQHRFQAVNHRVFLRLKFSF